MILLQEQRNQDPPRTGNIREVLLLCFKNEDEKGKSYGKPGGGEFSKDCLLWPHIQ